jgi:phenylacetate-CoA ligase
MTVQMETEGGDVIAYQDSITAVFKLKGKVQIIAPGGLPNDGKVIDDQRNYDG